MAPSRAIADLEADIVALRAAAERAGTALACLFSSSDEFEAAVVRLRREQGAQARPQRHEVGAGERCEIIWRQLVEGAKGLHGTRFLAPAAAAGILIHWDFDRAGCGSGCAKCTIFVCMHSI